MCKKPCNRLKFSILPFEYNLRPLQNPFKEFRDFIASSRCIATSVHEMTIDPLCIDFLNLRLQPLDLRAGKLRG
jgi:hypothetical protein